MFLEKLEFSVDLNQIRKDLLDILNTTSWGVEQQIGLTHRPNATDKWKDSTGSLYDRNENLELVKESAFTEMNADVPLYLRTVLDGFCKFQNIQIGRARFMRLMPKTGLSVHFDNTERYHLVIETNKYSYISHTMQGPQVAAISYHLPADSMFYKVDTTREHFVYNGGNEDRIHLVISPRK